MQKQERERLKECLRNIKSAIRLGNVEVAIIHLDAVIEELDIIR